MAWLTTPSNLNFGGVLKNPSGKIDMDVASGLCLNVGIYDGGFA